MLKISINLILATFVVSACNLSVFSSDEDETAGAPTPPTLDKISETTNSDSSKNDNEDSSTKKDVKEEDPNAKTLTVTWDKADDPESKFNDITGYRLTVSEENETDLLVEEEVDIDDPDFEPNAPSRDLVIPSDVLTELSGKSGCVKVFAINRKGDSAPSEEFCLKF